MVTTDTLGIMNQAIGVAIKIAAPMLLVSMGIGLLIAILQAATQIHEQTITFVPKLFLLGLMLLVAGGWMLETLMDLFRRVFELMMLL
jgi:flagellar biosynthetic protein FliQ